MKATIHITLKNGILDPQGKAIGQALAGMGFQDIGEVRQGKLIEIVLPDTLAKEDAEKALQQMCEKLLANPVMEDYAIALHAA